MSESRLNEPHLMKIQAVLDALGTPDPAQTDQRGVAYAIVVLEDAMVACQLALSFGLSLEGMRRQHLSLLLEAKHGPQA